MSLGEGVFPTERRCALYLRGRSLKEEVCYYWKGYVLVEGVSLKEVFPYERGCVLQRGVVCGMFLWEETILLGRDMSSGRCDLGARGLSLQEVRTCGRGMLL